MYPFHVTTDEFLFTLLRQGSARTSSLSNVKDPRSSKNVPTEPWNILPSGYD